MAYYCNCMGPQNGDPLCPCQMAAARGYLFCGLSGQGSGGRSEQEAPEQPVDGLLRLIAALNDEQREEFMRRAGLEYAGGDDG